MARRPLTVQQRRVLDAIRAVLDAEGRAPTFAEIGQTVGVTAATVHWHISALEAGGYIRRPAHGSRRGAIGVCDAPESGLRLGRVLARLRIPVPGGPTSRTCDHPRTASNRWRVAGADLCRLCGRQALAAHLAAKKVG